MILKVNPHKIEIKRDLINEKEINVTKCYFEFVDEITEDYVKEAYFTFVGTTYKQLIVNNECDIPSEVLEYKGQVEIGVVAFKTINGEYEIRYNPSPAYFSTLIGSLKDHYENSSNPTPSEIEQIESAIANKQDILVSGTNIKTINNQSILGSGNINVQGGGSTYTAGENIQISEDNVISATDTIYDDTEIRQDISDKEDKNNKVTSISSISTNDEYPSALAVYNLFNSITNYDNVGF